MGSRAKLFPWCVFLLVGCSPIVIADFSEIEVIRPDVPISGAPTTDVSTAPFAFEILSGSLGANTNPTAQGQMKSVKLHEISLVAKNDVNGRFTDLSFIDTLYVVAFLPLNKSSTDTPAGEVVEVANYQRIPGKPVGDVLTIPPPEPIDLKLLLRPRSNEQAKIEVSAILSGLLPTAAWKVDVKMTVSIEVRQ